MSNVTPTISKIATSRKYPGCILFLVNGYEDDGIYIYDVQKMQVYGENTPQYDLAFRVEKYGQEYLERCIVAPVKFSCG